MADLDLVNNNNNNNNNKYPFFSRSAVTLLAAITICGCHKFKERIVLKLRGQVASKTHLQKQFLYNTNKILDILYVLFCVENI
jgi:hypothetical protein